MLAQRNILLVAGLLLMSHRTQPLWCLSLFVEDCLLLGCACDNGFDLTWRLLQALVWIISPQILLLPVRWATVLILWGHYRCCRGKVVVVRLFAKYSWAYLAWFTQISRIYTFISWEIGICRAAVPRDHSRANALEELMRLVFFTSYDILLLDDIYDYFTGLP